MSEPARMLALDGCYNLRDVGGYPTRDGGYTRWRTLLRADSLHGLPPASQQMLLETGLRTVIDLRRDREVAAAPNVFLTSIDVTYFHLSLFGDPEDHRAAERLTLLDLYKAALDNRQPSITAVLDIMAQPDTGPVLLHCTAGKDRTGIVIALLLELLGVSRNIIAEDYVMSEHCIEPLKAGFRDQARHEGRDLNAFEMRLKSHPSYILTMLDYLDDRYGGAVSFVHRCGITSAQLKKLKKRFVVESMDPKPD